MPIRGRIDCSRERKKIGLQNFSKELKIMYSFHPQSDIIQVNVSDFDRPRSFFIIILMIFLIILIVLIPYNRYFTCGVIVSRKYFDLFVSLA